MRTVERVALALLVASLAACGGNDRPVPAQPAPPPAELHEGDLHIRASAVRTSSLPAQVARGYGIARGETTWMLLVTVRSGANEDTSVPATVEASAIDLQGRRIDIRMRAQRIEGGFTDHIGTFSITPPDTLRYQVRVTPANGAAKTLEFTREIPK